MRLAQMEAWVLSIVDTVAAGRRVEDARVELKADWPPPAGAARRISGHANAVGTDSILWIIGLDEKKGVTPPTGTDLATWLPQVKAGFDGLTPDVTDLVVPTPAGSVVALLFDASRRPFVVKNPVFGTTGGGAVALEVPWREGTSVRSARRDELIRILVPLTALPDVELLEASASLIKRGALDAGYGPVTPAQRSAHLSWNLNLVLYVTPRATDLLVLPRHKASLTFRIGGGPDMTATVRFFAPHRSVGAQGDSVPDSSTVRASQGEAVLTGPGLLHARGDYYERVRVVPSAIDISGTLLVRPAGSDQPVAVTFQLREAQGAGGDDNRKWEL